MYCHNCGKEIQDGSSYCSHCGAPQAGAPHYSRADTGWDETFRAAQEQAAGYDWWSLGGFALALLGIGRVWGIVGLALSIYGLTNCRHTGKKGRGFAVAGIIIGAVSAVLWVMVLLGLFSLATDSFWILHHLSRL